MDKLNIKHVDKIATDIANLSFGDLEQKRVIRDNIMSLVAVACTNYGSSDSFKREIDEYAHHDRLK